MTIHYPTAPLWAQVDFISEKSPARDFRVSLEDIESGSGHLFSGDLANYEADGIPFEQNDILFGKLRPYLAKFYWAENSGTAGGDLHVYRPLPHVNSRFIFYVISSDLFIGYANVSTTGVKMPRTDWAALRNFQTPLPPLEIQQAIAEYLDREMNEINTMLTKLNKLSRLLEERRQNATNEILASVSPNATWVQCKLLCQINTGTGDTQDATEDGKFPFYVRSQTPRKHPTWEFDGEAVLTAGDGVGVGKVFHLASGKFMAHQRVYVLNNFRGVTASYFYHVFKWLFPQAAKDGSAKNTVDSVRQPMIANLKVPLPSLDEQECIVIQLNETTARINAMSTKAQELKDLLIERRSALITAAVTGEIEVR